MDPAVERSRGKRFVIIAAVMALTPVAALVAVICRPPCDTTRTNDARVRGRLGQVWIEANLSEFQLAHVRLGQPASLVAKIYGERITYEGKVVGYALQTHAAFAPSSAREAVREASAIAQRPPVRIELNPDQLAAQLLLLGLPIEVNIDTSDRTGAALTVVAGIAQTHETKE